MEAEKNDDQQRPHGAGVWWMRFFQDQCGIVLTGNSLRAAADLLLTGEFK